MFLPITEKERLGFIHQNDGCFIPGYTGHCPTLRFSYGRPYGTKTREILRELKDKQIIKQVFREEYRSDDPGKVVLKPILKEKDQFRDYALDIKYRSPKFIVGYTGFVPTLNFRYGKSYGRTADDSICEFKTKQRRLKETRDELKRAFSAPKVSSSIRSKDEVMLGLKNYEDRNRYKDRNREVSPEFPPIAGYTGYIPKVKGNEVSLSHRYDTVVRKGLSLLREEREKRNTLQEAQNKIEKIFDQADGKFSYKKC